MTRTVLLVEDEEPLVWVIARNLQARGHEVTLAGTVADALSALDGHDFDLMLLDIDLPDRTGWDVVRELRARGRDVPFVVVSAVRINPEQLAEFRPLAYLPKPFPLDALLRIVADGRPSADIEEPEDEVRARGDAELGSTLEDYDRHLEAARRSAALPDLLRSEWEQRFAELTAHVIVPGMTAVEAELVSHGHRAELVEEQHVEGPPAWARGAVVTLAVLPGGWDFSGPRHRLRPRISFVANGEKQGVEVHGWLARPGQRGEGGLRATLTLDEVTRDRVERELRSFLGEVFGARTDARSDAPTRQAPNDD